MAVLMELEKLVEKMNKDPEHIENEKDRVFLVELEESGPVQIILQGGRVEVQKGEAADPAVTLKLNEANFSKLLRDDLNTTMAFMTGGLKVDGSIGLALKLQEIVKKYQ